MKGVRRSTFARKEWTAQCGALDMIPRRLRIVPAPGRILDGTNGEIRAREPDVRGQKLTTHLVLGVYVFRPVLEEQVG